MASNKAKAAKSSWQLVHGRPGSSTVSRGKTKNEETTTAEGRHGDEHGGATRDIARPKSKRTTLLVPHRKPVRFPQVKGKNVEGVEFFSEPHGQAISINFRDKTCLNFSIEAGFTLKTDYSDFKTGEQRIIRKWPMIRST